jgi:hypothetical protein
MKRIIRIAFITLIVSSIPIVTLTGQDKSTTKHVKVVVVDKSGNKTELDTLLKECPMADSIKLKNGDMVYIGKHGSMAETMAGAGSHNCEMSMTINSDKEGKEKIIKKYRIVAGDSTKIIKDKEGEDIIIVKEGKHIVEGKGGDVMVWSSDKAGSKGENVIYINEGKEDLKNGEKIFNVQVTSDDSDSGNEVEKTKYVLAKDGMVISIEGNDEAKVKDLVKDIESKMGVKKETAVKPVVKEEAKKTLKK